MREQSGERERRLCWGGMHLQQQPRDPIVPRDPTGGAADAGARCAAASAFTHRCPQKAAPPGRGRHGAQTGGRRSRRREWWYLKSARGGLGVKRGLAGGEERLGRAGRSRRGRRHLGLARWRSRARRTGPSRRWRWSPLPAEQDRGSMAQGAFRANGGRLTGPCFRKVTVPSELVRWNGEPPHQDGVGYRSRHRANDL